MGTNCNREKRILLVDDEWDIRQVYQLLLSEAGYQVTEAGDGAEGLARFASGHFDLVITDREMPVMKGDEMARKIKQVAPRQPVLMITAYPGTIGPENPVDALLNKPFQLEEFRRTIKTLLAMSAAA